MAMLRASVLSAFAGQGGRIRSLDAAITRAGRAIQMSPMRSPAARRPRDERNGTTKALPRVCGSPRAAGGVLSGARSRAPVAATVRP